MKKRKSLLRKSVIVFWILIFSMSTTDNQMAMVVIKEKPEAPEWFSEQQKEKFEKEKELLARVIYGEASNQEEEGMIAVGNVVMNRFKSTKDWWGNDIESIIKMPKQFSVFNDTESGNYKRMMNATEDDKVYQQALKIAEGLLTGNIEDNTEGSTHYYNPDEANPDWADDPLVTKIKKIGDHTFLMEA